MLPVPYSTNYLTDVLDYSANMSNLRKSYNFPLLLPNIDVNLEVYCSSRTAFRTQKESDNHLGLGS